MIFFVAGAEIHDRKGDLLGVHLDARHRGFPRVLSLKSFRASPETARGKIDAWDPYSRANRSLRALRLRASIFRVFEKDLFWTPSRLRDRNT